VFETFRLNSVHLSYRMNRIPFRQHWAVLFVCCFVVFGLVAVIMRGFASKSKNILGSGPSIYCDLT
jgi:hypothetical protein